MGVADGVAVKVTLGVTVGDAVCVDKGGTGVLLKVTVEVELGVSLTVRVGVEVEVDVKVTEGVAVRVEDSLGVTVAVDKGGGEVTVSVTVGV